MISLQKRDLMSELSKTLPFSSHYSFKLQFLRCLKTLKKGKKDDIKCHISKTSVLEKAMYSRTILQINRGPEKLRNQPEATVLPDPDLELGFLTLSVISSVKAEPVGFKEKILQNGPP